MLKLRTTLLNRQLLCSVIVLLIRIMWVRELISSRFSHLSLNWEEVMGAAGVYAHQLLSAPSWSSRQLGFLEGIASEAAARWDCCLWCQLHGWGLLATSTCYFFLYFTVYIDIKDNFFAISEGNIPLTGRVCLGQELILCRCSVWLLKCETLLGQGRKA